MPGMKIALLATLGVAGMVLGMLALRSSLRDARRSRYLRRHGLPAVATTTSWEWDNSEHGDCRYRPIVSFTTADGQSIEQINLHWHSRRSEGRPGETFEVFYGPDKPREVRSGRPSYVAQHRVISVSLSIAVIVGSAWFAVFVLLDGSGVAVPSPAVLLPDFDEIDGRYWGFGAPLLSALAFTQMTAIAGFNLLERLADRAGCFGIALMTLCTGAAGVAAVGCYVLAYLGWAASR